MNPLYEIIQQQQAQYHNEQMKNIDDCVSNFKDFIHNRNKVAPEYQQELYRHLVPVALSELMQEQNRI